VNQKAGASRKTEKRQATVAKMNFIDFFIFQNTLMDESSL